MRQGRKKENESERLRNKDIQTTILVTYGRTSNLSDWEKSGVVQGSQEKGWELKSGVKCSLFEILTEISQGRTLLGSHHLDLKKSRLQGELGFSCSGLEGKNIDMEAIPES